MTRLLKILILFSLLVCAPTAYADDDGTNITVPLPKREFPPINPHKHKAPSFVRVLFSYDITAGEASFEFPGEVEYIDIEAENLDTHIIYMGSASVDFPVWQQELPSGEYIITCTAGNGDVFEGYVYI